MSKGSRNDYAIDDFELDGCWTYDLSDGESRIGVVMHPGNFECFMDVYAEKLREARIKFPDQYAWPETEFELVLGRMRTAIERGTFNKDGQAMKATCKALGIKHTYTAIREYIS